MPAIVRLAALAAALALSGTAYAQGTYPDRPVKVIVPFAAAGPTDVVARLITQKLSEKLGQQFYIENWPAPAAISAWATAAKAPPDGYTILFVSSSFTVNASLYAKPPYDPGQGLHAGHQGGRPRPTGCSCNPDVIPAKSIEGAGRRCSRPIPASTRSRRPASAPRRICRASCSSTPSGSIMAGAVPGRRPVDPVGGRRPHADLHSGDPSRDPVGEGRQAARARHHRQEALDGTARRSHLRRGRDQGPGGRDHAGRAGAGRHAEGRSSTCCRRRSPASSNCRT